MAPVTYIVNGQIVDAHGNVYDEGGNLIQRAPPDPSELSPDPGLVTYVVGGRLVDAHGHDHGPAHAAPELLDESVALNPPPQSPFAPLVGSLSVDDVEVKLIAEDRSVEHVEEMAWAVTDPAGLITSNVWDLLNKNFDSAEAVTKASDDELLEIKGIGQPTVDKIRMVIGPAAESDA